MPSDYDSSDAALDRDSFSQEDERSDEEVEVLHESLDEEQYTDWGSAKKGFYNSDEDAESASGSDAEMLLEETLRVQRKQAALLHEEDFFPDPDSFQSLLAQGDFSKISQQICDKISDEKTDGSDQIAGLLDELNASLQAVNTESNNKEESVEGGLSFYNSKNALLLNYSLNIVFFLMLKAQGKQTEGHPVISHLVRIKLLLEKVAAMELKLAPQSDRLIKAATQQHATEKIQQASASFKPNLAEFLADDDGSGQEEQRTYKAPRIAPVHYNDPAAKKSSSKNPPIRRGILKDLRAEFDERPEEIFDDALLEGDNDDGASQRQLAFEESNFKRVSTSKRDSNGAQKRRFTNELVELNAFDREGSKQKDRKAAHKKRR